MYLSTLFELTDKDFIAIAAYNAGPDVTKKALKD